MMMIVSKKQRLKGKLKHGTLSSIVLSCCVVTNVMLAFLLTNQSGTPFPKGPDETWEGSIPIAYQDPMSIDAHRLATFRRMGQDYCEYPEYDNKQEGRVPVIFRSKLSTPDGGQQGSHVNRNHDVARRRLSAETSTVKKVYYVKRGNIKNLANSTIASTSSKKLTFLHLGKTSGTAVAKALKVAYAPSNVDYWPGETPFFDTATKLSISVRKIIHTGNILEFLAEDGHIHSRFLITVRNPVHRMQSWFDYENHFEDSRIYCGKAMLYSCYMRFDQLATVGLSGPKPDPLVYKVAADLSQEECSAWAWGAIQGNASAKSHNFFNYERYTSTIFPIKDREIFVIRSEHTWNDWRTIDLMLGGSGVLPFKEGEQKKSNVNKWGDKGITEAGIANVCRALCDEIQIYKRLLVEAVNLNDDDRQQSLEELRKVCPLETSLSTRVCSYN